jgi:adenine specific DNA methylase Mod
MLIWGDNKFHLASLLKQFKGAIDLIYIDPPFDVGADFTMDVPIGDNTETTYKDQSALEMVAYRDTWGKNTDSYLHTMYERLILMRELLSDKGSIFVHSAWHTGHLIRGLLDELFDRRRLVNEIVWYYYNKFQGNINRFAFNHDNIFWYAKSDCFTFHKQHEKRESPSSRQ